MSDFSKYLDNKEELISIFKSKSNKSRLYLNLLLLLIAFFVLYPIWRGAQDGFWLWLIMVVIIVNNIIQVFLAQKDLYLLSNSRIIYLKAITSKDFKNKKSLYLRNIKAIKKGEDRQLFKQSMQKIGLDLPKSGKAHSLKEAVGVA